MTKLLQFLSDLVKGRATFLEVSVIGAGQKRTEMFACDFFPFGVQVIGRLPDFRSCPFSPPEGLNLPVVRKAVGDGATLMGVTRTRQRGCWTLTLRRHRMLYEVKTPCY